MVVFCSVPRKMDATSPLRLSAATLHSGQRLMHHNQLCQTVSPLQPRKRAAFGKRTILYGCVIAVGCTPALYGVFRGIGINRIT